MKIENDKPQIQNDSSIKEKIRESRNDLKVSILEQVEKKVQDKFSDEELDRESLKIELRNGYILDLEKVEFVTGELQTYERRFPQEYYQEIFRLNRSRGPEWLVPENGIISKKPHIVGKWTKEIIYSRFGKNMLPALENFNPYVKVGIRRHKHYQFLDENGIRLLDKYISDSIAIMKASNDWYEFRIKLYQVHQVPYQLDVFREMNR